MIIDTHVHVYDPFRPEGAPWPDPENTLLHRTTLPLHVKEQAVPEQVDGVVVVEASEWIEDNQWILDIAAEDPFVVGLVGRLEPGDENFEKDLERFAPHPIFQGIRFWGGYFEDVSQNGFVDKIVQRKDLNSEIGSLLSILLKENSEINLENSNETPELSIKTREAS